MCALNLPKVNFDHNINIFGTKMQTMADKMKEQFEDMVNKIPDSYALKNDGMKLITIYAWDENSDLKCNQLCSEYRPRMYINGFVTKFENGILGKDKDTPFYKKFEYGIFRKCSVKVLWSDGNRGTSIRSQRLNDIYTKKSVTSENIEQTEKYAADYCNELAKNIRKIKKDDYKDISKTIVKIFPFSYDSTNKCIALSKAVDKNNQNDGFKLRYENNHIFSGCRATASWI